MKNGQISVHGQHQITTYIEEYNLFLNKWREFKNQTHKIIFVRYIDLLEKPEEILTQIQAKFELKKKLSFLILNSL